MRDYSGLLRENAFSHIRNRNAAITYSDELRCFPANVTHYFPFDRPMVKSPYQDRALIAAAVEDKWRPELQDVCVDSDSRSFSMDFEVIAPSFSH